MTRLEQFRAALVATEELLKRYPADGAIHSIVIQLRFLIDLEEGKSVDHGRLKDITIGILTVREIEVLDLQLAELLYQVSAEVDRM